MLRLHYYPGFISLAPHIVLEEIDADYELSFVNLHRGPSKSPSYLALHPDGLVPALEDGSLVLYESTAIILHLVEPQQEGLLMPERNSALRPQFYKWLMWLSTALDANLSQYLHPSKIAVSAETQADVRDSAERRVDSQFDRLDDELARHGGTMVSRRNLYCGRPLSFHSRAVVARHGSTRRSRPQLGAYLRRMIERPAVQRAHAQEHIPQPWV